MSTHSAGARDIRWTATVPEVVAGLANDECAGPVAAAAVRLARALGAQVRFVHILREGTTNEGRADLDSDVFAAALKALRGRPRIQATFERVDGEPGALLVDRSGGALGLVVGADHVEKSETAGLVADYCLLHARCRVHVVDCAAP